MLIGTFVSSDIIGAVSEAWRLVYAAASYMTRANFRMTSGCLSAYSVVVNHAESTKNGAMASYGVETARTFPDANASASEGCRMNAASTRCSTTAAGIAETGSSTKRTVFASPPVASIHASIETVLRSLSAETAIVFPAKSLPVAKRASVATTSLANGFRVSWTTPAAITTSGRFRRCAFISESRLDLPIS